MKYYCIKQHDKSNLEVEGMDKKNLCITYFILLPICSDLLSGIMYALFEANGQANMRDAIDAYVTVLLSLLFGIYVAYRNRNVMKRDYVELERLPKVFLRKALVSTAASLLVILLCGCLIDTFFPQATWGNQQAVDLYRSIVPLPLYALNICIFAPIVEEFVFRHTLQNAIKQKPWNVILIALLFGLLHAGFHIEILYYTVVGLCLGIVYEKTQDINVPICMHMVNNIVATLF